MSWFQRLFGKDDRSAPFDTPKAKFCQKMIFSRLTADKAVSDKLGGYPFGLPSSAWPNSPNTGLPMTFLGYFSEESTRSYLFMSPSWDEEATMHFETYDPKVGEIALVPFPLEQLSSRADCIGPTLEAIFSISYTEVFDRYESEFGPFPLECSKIGGDVCFIQEDVPFEPGYEYFLQLDSHDVGYVPLERFVGDGILYVFRTSDGTGVGTWQCT